MVEGERKKERAKEQKCVCVCVCRVSSMYVMRMCECVKVNENAYKYIYLSIYLLLIIQYEANEKTSTGNAICAMRDNVTVATENVIWIDEAICWWTRGYEMENGNHKKERWAIND